MFRKINIIEQNTDTKIKYQNRTIEHISVYVAIPRYIELCRASLSSYAKYAFIISLIMEKASKNISVVEPTFSVRPPSNQEQIYCEICLKSCIKKHKYVVNQKRQLTSRPLNYLQKDGIKNNMSIIKF